MASQRGVLQLLDALDKKGGKTPAFPACPMPTGFLEDLATRFEHEGLEDMLGPPGMSHLYLPGCDAQDAQGSRSRREKLSGAASPTVGWEHSSDEAYTGGPHDLILRD